MLAYPAGTERTQRIHVIQARVESINAEGRFLCLTGGNGFGYGSLLIATGSKPNGLPADTPGRDFDGVLTLHRLHDYQELRRRLPQVREAVVIGGGIHACETAISLLEQGVRVHWLMRSEAFLPKLLDRAVSATLLACLVRHKRIRISTATELSEIVGRRGSVTGVVTNRHEFLPCQLVIACTGTMANTTLATSCTLPLKMQHGIVVDDECRTNVPHIYAAGDVTAPWNPATGSYAPRAQWYTAVVQGRNAAASMTGHRELVTPLGVPWQAMHLGGDLSLLTVGVPLACDEAYSTLSATGKGASYHRITLQGDRLVGYLALGRTQPDSLAIKHIIDEGIPVGAVKHELLQADFDANAYVSRWKAYRARFLVIRGTESRTSSTQPIPALALA